MMMDDSVIEKLFKTASDTEYVSRAKIAAAVVRRGNIVTEETNSMKTHPFQKKFGRNSDSIHLHAEIHAIMKALKTVEDSDLSKYDLYVVRVKKHNDNPKGDYIFGNAKPCAGCQKAIATFGIKNVYYSTDEGTIDFL